MRKVLFLNGCINSGKTTVARKLKADVNNLAHVEVDDLQRFISWMPIEQSIRLNLDNAAKITETFVGAGIDVVISYPLSKPNYDYLLTKLGSVEAEFIPITLFTSMENAKQNRGDRNLEEWELRRIEWMYANGLANPGFGQLIDNSRLSIDATVASIIKIAGLARTPTDSEKPKA
jgi:hypothetical protein